MSKRLQVTLDDDVAKTLFDLAQTLGISKSGVIALSIRDYARKEKKMEKEYRA